MPAIVNRAAIIAFLVSGTDKAKTLQQVLKGKYLPEKFPAQLIHPVSNQLHWFIDEPAASELVDS
jgi:6-phosphogluconolactonase